VKPLVTTIWTSVAVGVLCLATAAPMAYLVARTDLPWKRFFRVMILASFVTPPFLGRLRLGAAGRAERGHPQPVVLRAHGLKAFEAQPLSTSSRPGGWCS
jgi:ABC-type Fe3+ transport system permease subunit